MLPYVQSYRDRHGHLRHYLRRPGFPRVTLPRNINSPDFVRRYSEAMARPDTKPAIGATRHAPDSVARWVALYMESATFAALAPDTRRTRRNLLDRFRAKHGDRRATTLRQTDIERLVGTLTPVVARNFLKALRPWLKWCVAQGMRADNPATDVERPTVKSQGYKTWPEEYVSQYRKRHTAGTEARLALELLVNTGAARADIVRLGRQHAHGGMLSFRRHKTGVLVEIPILPELAAILADLSQHDGQLTYLLNGCGRPFTDAGFGNWFRDRCNEAGIPVGYSAHGVRKYAATLRANLGATAHQLMAWFGWLSIREAERYTRDAERRRLAVSLGNLMQRGAP